SLNARDCEKRRVSKRFEAVFLDFEESRGEERRGETGMEGVRYYVDRYFLLWMFPLLRRGASGKLIEDDIPELEKEQRSEHLKKQWRKEWADTFEEFDSRRRNGRLAPGEKPSIILPIFRIFNTRLIFSLGTRVVEDFVHFAKPLLLSLLIEYLSSSDASMLYGAIIIAGCYVMAQLRSSLYNVFTREQNELATMKHSILSSAIYEKSLRLSPSSRAITSDGDVMNLVMGDVQSMFDAFRLMHNFISAPLQFIFAFGLLWRTLGPATIAALTVTAVMIPLNQWVWDKSKGLIGERGRVKGERIKTCTEMLSGMKVIKLYAWESAFEEKIEKLRREEVDFDRRGNIILRASDLINISAPFIMALLCFSIYLFTDAHGVLTPQVALFSLTIFNQIQFPVELCRSLIYVCSFCAGSHDRLRTFFALEESDEIADNISDDDVIVDIDNASFGWKEGDVTLQDVDLSLKKGSFTAVMGSVGAGKSSLLSAIAGSMHLQSGSFNRRGSVALVSQQTWLMNTTVRENILFGREFEASRYQKIVKACELEHDFAVPADGDQTIVGENGSLLSSGQKARVSLARAVYQNADLYLLDDPLSAVDVHIGESIYRNVIGSNGMLKDKTRLLVTHNVKYTEGATVMIVKSGKFTKDIEDLSKLAALEKEVKEAESTEATEIPENIAELRKRKQSEREDEQAEEIPESEEDKKEPNENIWMYLIRAAGYSNIILFLLLQTLHYAFQSARSIYVASWSNDDGEMGSRIWSFAMFGGSETLCFVVSCYFLQAACAQCAINIHRPLLRDVLTLPMRFFDTHPIGDVLARFGNDLDTVDQALPMAVRSLLKSALQVISIFFVITYTSTFFIIVLIPLVILYFKILHLFISTSKQFRAMEQNTRAPIYSLIKECCTGRETIRAFAKEDHTTKLLGERLDSFSRAKTIVQLATRWLCHYIDILANLVVLFAALFAVISCRYFGVAPALAGLSLSYAFSMDMLNMFIHALSYIEHYKLGADRIRDYSGLVKEQLSIERTESKEWIEEPTVEIQNLSVRYADDLPLVLKNISISIGAREKVAVVGRTGSGKSSLTMALFRMVEPFSGAISISGKPIDSVVLKDLRNALAIIPQDPVLFSGTLRSNVDPFGACSNDELWKALEQCQMKETIESLGGLDCQIDESGKNLSVGQRQLLCLARVLVRRVKILILDEATSSIDIRSADLIHTVVRDRFAHATVISIAHRLESIEGYDRVLVMQDGEVVEFDSPANLMKNHDSKYTQMMRK
ncbi:hypothetical protein PENTCL1PPCAC_982, partial [Pristionchus entomophagus]